MLRSIPCLGSLLLLSACAPQPASSPNPSAGRELAGVTLLTESFPLEARLADGAALTLDAAAERILAGNAAVYDYLCELVGPERIVGLPRRAPEFSLSWAAGKTLAEAKLLDKLDSETVIGLAPDLAVVHGWQPLEQKVQWRRSGLALIELPDVEHFEDTIAALDLLAILTDRTAKFEPRRAQLVHRAATLRKQSSGAGRRALAYINSGTGGWVAGAGTTADAVFELVGLVNAAAGYSGHSQVEIEDVLLIDPDFLVFALEPGEAHSGTLSYLRNEPRFASLRALRESNWIELPTATWSSNTHHMLDAAEQLADHLR